jgi:hypothetical protein
MVPRDATFPGDAGLVAAPMTLAANWRAVVEPGGLQVALDATEGGAGETLASLGPRWRTRVRRGGAAVAPGAEPSRLPREIP